MDRTVFPGRQAVLDRLQRIHKAGKLGQPFLFAGPEGSGKENTALEFARRLNCAEPETCAVDRLCESCVKTVSFQHPDVHWVGPAPAAVSEADVRGLLDAKRDNPFYASPWAATSQIGIGDPDDPAALTIRSVIHFLRKHAFQGRYKIAIVSDAHRMNQAAANAFLKTLEEPPPNTVIFLLSAGTEGLLPTILSRCQKIPFDPWPEPQLVELVQGLADTDPASAAQAARVADGNARRALALLEPESRALFTWAGQLFYWINNADRAQCAVSADELHRGLMSHACRPDDKSAKAMEVKEAAARRGRVIRLCELMNLHYSDAIACREMATHWVPRLEAAADLVRQVAQRRTTDGLLRDIAVIDAAAREVDRNINIGLVMAVLFEGLIDNVAAEQ